jgi:hypothetical protein
VIVFTSGVRRFKPTRGIRWNTNGQTVTGGIEKVTVRKLTMKKLKSPAVLLEI